MPNNEERNFRILSESTYSIASLMLIFVSNIYYLSQENIEDKTKEEMIFTQMTNVIACMLNIFSLISEYYPGFSPMSEIPNQKKSFQSFLNIAAHATHFTNNNPTELMISDIFDILCITSHTAKFLLDLPETISDTCQLWSEEENRTFDVELKNIAKDLATNDSTSEGVPKPKPAPEPIGATTIGKPPVQLCVEI